MTREQAITNFIDEDACCQGRVDVPRLINRIYDDFESRVCENCKYCELIEDEGFCIKSDIYMFVYLDFGCNKFERKKDD